MVEVNEISDLTGPVVARQIAGAQMLLDPTK